MRNKVALALLAIGCIIALRRYVLSGRQPPSSPKVIAEAARAIGRDAASGSPAGGGKKSARVDMKFLRRLRAIFSVCYPAYLSIESAYLLVLISLLVLRTRLTVVMANVIGENAKRLVQRDVRQFAAGVLDIGLWSLPSSVVNSGIRYTTTLLESRFRKNLQTFLHQHYMQDGNVFKIAGGNSDEKLDNPDHRITQDVQLFCFEVADMFSMVFKPTMDLVTFVLQLSKIGGVLPPMIMILYYLVAGFGMRQLMPNFAKLTALTAQREADFRHIHGQIIRHAEEVAFYRGERIERENADRYIDTLVKHHLNVKGKQSISDFMDGVLIKYGATCVGYAVCSMSVFAAKAQGAGAAELTGVYIRNSQLYIPLAKAIGKLVMLHKRFTALAGYTFRVGELCETLEALEARQEASGRSADSTHLLTSARTDQIVFSGVTIRAPGGSILVRDLSITIDQGRHVLIMGPNGSGKTSILRAFAGLWPIEEGTITRPDMKHITVVSQRTFLPTGTMRQQLIYPTDEATLSKDADAQLMALVAEVGLTAVVEREGGLDVLKEWHEVLSGGERQRVAFVRLLFHRSAFGILDEATSAVSQDIEPAMYIAAVRRGITLVTVSHREALKQFHNTVLVLDGLGGYTVAEGGASTAGAPAAVASA